LKIFIYKKMNGIAQEEQFCLKNNQRANYAYGQTIKRLNGYLFLVTYINKQCIFSNIKCQLVLI